VTHDDALALCHAEATRCALDGWAFVISARMRVGFGLCHHATRTIKLNALYVENGDVVAIRNTILHEIAHALVGPKHGHDRTWKRKALDIGCDGRRCAKRENYGRHVGHCDKCGIRFTRGKRPNPRATYRHQRCGGAVVFADLGLRYALAS
jgi:predicted SprT family Zn-dependent metalloprotease